MYLLVLQSVYHIHFFISKLDTISLCTQIRPSRSLTFLTLGLVLRLDLEFYDEE